MDFHIQTPDGTNESVGFPGNLPVQQLLTEFITDESIRIHPREVVAWDLEEESGGQKLDLKKSLEQNGVKSGHFLRLVPVAAPQKSTSDSYRPGSGLTRCDNGHFYDGGKYKTCPYDAPENTDPGTKSIRIGSPRGEVQREERDTIPVRYGGGGVTELGADQPTRRIGQGGPGGIDAVVGWLVCVHGKNRGRDYRIRSENNTVGREEDMDICISGDDLISRKRHTVITFDPQQNTFHLSPAEGRSLVFLNNKAVLMPQELKPYDEILLGATKLRFVPFCGDKFKWS